MDYMYKNCTCVGTRSKQCFRDKICQLVLPTMDEVAAKLKMIYHHRSSHAVIIPSSARVLVVERKNHRKVDPGKMIYFRLSPDYCVADADYNIKGITERECALNDTSSSYHCNNLCCDHGYKTVTHRDGTLCCRFIWCCKIKCKICYETTITYRCKSKPDASSTS